MAIRRICDFCGDGTLGNGYAFRVPDRLIAGKAPPPISGYADVCDTCIGTKQIQIVAALVAKTVPEVVKDE